MTIGELMSTFAERLHDPLGDFLALGDATEDVDEDRSHRRVVVDDLQRVRHHLRVRAAADVEEVRRLAADLVDDVARRHRESGAVCDDADRAVEPDVLEALLAPPRARAGRASRVLRSSSHSCGGTARCRRGSPWRRARARCPSVVRISGLISTRSAVAVDVRVVQLHQDVDRAVGGRGIRASRRSTHCAALRLGESVDRVDVDPRDGVGVRRRRPVRSRRRPAPTASRDATWRCGRA